MRNRQQTEARILDAATLLFSQNGLHGVSVRAIASEARVNLSLISQYFGGKTALYERCLESLYEEFQIAMPKVVSGFERVSSPQQTIAFAIASAIELGRTRRTAVLLTMRHFIEHGQLDSSRRETVLIPTIEYLHERLRPHSKLTDEDLRMAIFGAIVLVGRLIAFTQDDLSSVGTYVSEKHVFTTSTSDLVVRMLGIESPPKKQQHVAVGAT